MRAEDGNDTLKYRGSTIRRVLIKKLDVSTDKTVDYAYGSMGHSEVHSSGSMAMVNPIRNHGCTTMRNRQYKITAPANPIFICLILWFPQKKCHTSF